MTVASAMTQVKPPAAAPSYMSTALCSNCPSRDSVPCLGSEKAVKDGSSLGPDSQVQGLEEAPGS